MHIHTEKERRLIWFYKRENVEQKQNNNIILRHNIDLYISSFSFIYL